ncbi:MAG: hypothetical protein ACFB0B_14490 [Thermonemataceae bacterium]
MVNINKEKLLATRAKLLGLLKSKELNTEVERLIREDLRNVEKELEELEGKPNQKKD